MIDQQLINKIFNDEYVKSWRPSGTTISIKQMKSRMLRPLPGGKSFKFKMPLMYDFKAPLTGDRLRTNAHGDVPIHGSSSMDTHPRRPIDDNN